MVDSLAVIRVYVKWRQGVWSCVQATANPERLDNATYVGVAHVLERMDI